MRIFALAILTCWLFQPSIFGQKIIVLQPGAAEGTDAFINSAFPDFQWGTDPILVSCAWTYDGVFGISRSLIKFDLTQIPPDAEILDARLTLFFNPDATYGEQYGENASEIVRISEDWDEMTATWSTQPLYDNSDPVYIAKTMFPDQDLTDIDVTKQVSEWVLHPETNFGLMHRMSVEVKYCCLVYSSSDHPNSAKRPKLVVRYRECNSPVAGFTSVIQIPKVNYTDTSSSATTWFWDFGDGYFSNLQNPEHIYDTPGIYEVCLIISDSCGTDTTCKSVKVCDMPNPHFSYTASDQMVSFRDSSTAPESWFWDFGDGFFSDLQDPQHYFNEPGTYYVCEKVTNSCGIQDYCDSVTIIMGAVDDHSKEFTVRIFPNPARDFAMLQVSTRTKSDVSVELLTPENRIVNRWTSVIMPGEGNVPLHLGGHPKGIYFLKTKIDGVTRMNKLIIL